MEHFLKQHSFHNVPEVYKDWQYQNLTIHMLVFHTNSSADQKLLWVALEMVTLIEYTE